VNQPNVHRIKKLLKSVGITQDQVAEAAGVGRTCVSHVLSGRLKSANVVETARRLLAEAREKAVESVA
jgi:predicted transcriptional regulator